MSNTKQAYYFSHDCNARLDEKVLALRMKHGWEGYGLYWALVEKLRDASSYSLRVDYNIIAFDLRSDAGKIKSIVEDFGLFAFTDDGECFYSERLSRSMDLKSYNAKKAADARWRNAGAMHTHNKGKPKNMQSDANKVKEKKVKEMKGDEREVKKKEIPAYEEFEKYALVNGENVSLSKLKLKYKAWKENNWKNGNGKVIKNWKSTLLNTLPYLMNETTQRSEQPQYHR